MPSDVSQIRPEIQGLRAIAVVAVLLFHLGITALPGGFLGVDVFFVISGYLISRSIDSAIQRGNFTLSGFWLRRIRRLLPASTIAIAATLLVSYVVLPPDEALDNAQAAIAALLSSSNIVFWLGAGYFDAPSLGKPLLHTWSLGVEEQFYLVWPILLVLTKKRSFIAVGLSITMLSFLAVYVFRTAAPSTVFYLMPFRIFELGIGASLAFARAPKLPSQLSYLGLAAILTSFTVLNETMALPGLLSLIPCLGTALVIASANGLLSRVLLFNRPVQFVGGISYSLYLVHWPVIVFYKYAHGPGLTIAEMSFLVAAILILSAALYFGIERPLRTTQNETAPRSRRAFRSIAGLVLVTATIALSALVSTGWRFRLAPELRATPSLKAMQAARFGSIRAHQCFLRRIWSSKLDQTECLSIKPDRRNYLIVGDSLAADLYSVLTQAYPEDNFLQITAGNCRPILDNSPYPLCGALLNFAFRDFVEHHQLTGIILHGWWGPPDAEGLKITSKFLLSQRQNVIVVGSGVRFQKSPPSLMFAAKTMTRREIEVLAYQNRYAFSDLNAKIKDALPSGAHFLGLESVFLERGPRLFDDEHNLLFVDNFHLTVYGATYLARIMAGRKLPRKRGVTFTPRLLVVETRTTALSRNRERVVTRLRA